MDVLGHYKLSESFVFSFQLIFSSFKMFSFTLVFISFTLSFFYYYLRGNVIL